MQSITATDQGNVQSQETSLHSKLTASWQEVPFLVRLLFIADFVMASLFVLSRVVHAQIGNVAQFVDMDREMNLPTWWSSLQLSLVAILLLTVAVLCRRLWPVIAAAGFALLSLDEFAMIHELIGVWVDQNVVARSDTIFSTSGIWFLICAPLFVVAFGLVAWMAWKDLRRDMKVIKLLAAGIGLFLLGAVVVESFSNLTPWMSWQYRVQVLVEESFEMVGVTLMAWAGVVLLQSLGVKLSVTREPEMLSQA